MTEPLELYLEHLARTGDHRAAVVRTAEALASEPWLAIQVAGALARCDVHTADRDLGLTRQLAITGMSGERAVVVVRAGQPYPVPRRRGAEHPPIHVARQVVRAAMAVVDGPALTAIDLACGTGSFLLAAVEAGIPEVYGTDLDELALEIAAIAVPRARLLREDPLKHGPWVDLVIGASPAVPLELIDARYRWELRRRYPWLKLRFDLAVAHAAAAAERARPGGSVGLVLPAGMLVKPYAAPLRRRWLERHRFVELAGPHVLPSGAEVVKVVLGIEQERCALPVFGVEPEELLRLETAPLDPDLMPGDIDLVRRIRQRSVPLGDVATVDSGLVIEGPEGGRQRLVFEDPGEDRVPFADAQQFFAGQSSWLDFVPHAMHEPKPRSYFASPKVVIQRHRGAEPIRAGLDFDGIYLDNSCTIVLPGDLPLRRILELVRNPWLDAVTRVERGGRFDLYPREVRQFPVPKKLLDDPDMSLKEAWGLTDGECRRLEALARR